jgi:hypothetical protein
MPITANPPAENTDPWYAARSTFDTQVKTVANSAEVAAASAQTTADAAQTTANGRVPSTRQVNGHALSADVTVTKGDVGLGNADNTSDANKPVSTAQAAAIALKVNTADVAGLNTVGWGRAVFIPLGGSVPGGTPTYTIVIEAGA